MSAAAVEEFATFLEGQLAAQLGEIHKQGIDRRRLRSSELPEQVLESVRTSEGLTRSGAPLKLPERKPRKLSARCGRLSFNRKILHGKRTS